MKHERQPITLTMDPPLHVCTCGFRGFARDVSAHIERENAPDDAKAAPSLAGEVATAIAALSASPKHGYEREFWENQQARAALGTLLTKNSKAILAALRAVEAVRALCDEAVAGDTLMNHGRRRARHCSRVSVGDIEAALGDGVEAVQALLEGEK